MGDNKHTPGPWHWVKSEDDQPWKKGYAVEVSLRTVAEFGKNEVVEREGKRYTSFALPKFIINAEDLGGDEGAEANARLIAAAPDLLEALEDLLSGIGTHDPEWAWQERSNARAAIAKATQSEPNP